MDKFSAFLHLHQAFILWCAGAYILAATLLNKKWPRPAAPPWLARLHLVFIDWPAALPSRSADGKGIVLHIFGVQVTIPLLSISDALAGPPGPPQNVQVTSMLSLLPLVFLAVVMSACAPGADGERQACANADHVLLGAYQTVRATVRVDQEALRDKLTHGALSPDDGQKQLDEHKAVGEKAFAGLDLLTTTKAGVCSLIGAKSNPIMETIAKVIAGVTKIVSSVQELLAIEDDDDPSAIIRLAGGINCRAGDVDCHLEDAFAQAEVRR